MTKRWVNIPFSPSSFGFFYGLVIVAATTLGVIASTPGQSLGVSAFTDYLIAAYGLSRTSLSTAYMVGTISSALILPFAGIALDRFGGRVMIVFSSIGLTLSIFIFAHASRFLPIDLDSSVIAFVSISVCFLLIRFFGQGCMTMVSRVTMNKWFNHRRGIAIAISGAFTSFGFNIAPKIIDFLIQTYSWRGACTIMALVAGVGMLVIGWLFYRDNPEQCDLVMDGITDATWRAKMTARVPDIYKQFTRHEAMLTLPFWSVNLGLATYSMLLTAIIFHITDICREAGLDRDTAFSIFIPMSIFSIATNIIAGRISDFVKLKWILAVMMLSSMLAIVGVLDFSTVTGRWLFIAGSGITGGLFTILNTVTWPRFYGRKHLGAISGVKMFILVFASAIGPVLFSKAHAISGSYRNILVTCFLFPIIVLLLSFFMRNPQNRHKPIV